MSRRPVWILGVACPHCGRARAESCVEPSGRRRRPHHVRVIAARTHYDPNHYSQRGARA